MPFDIPGLPKGAVIRGELSDMTTSDSWSADLMEVQLPSGFVVDVEWQETPANIYQVTVWQGFFGNQYERHGERDVISVVKRVQQLAWRYLNGEPSQ